MDLNTIVKDANVAHRPSWSTKDESAARVVIGEACPKPMGLLCAWSAFVLLETVLPTSF